MHFFNFHFTIGFNGLNHCMVKAIEVSRITLANPDFISWII